MSIKKLVENLTGRKCSTCRHNWNGRCCHPDGRMFMKCWHSLTHPGFERIAEQERQEYENLGAKFYEGFQAGYASTREKAAERQAMTAEEEYQLKKIIAELDMAEDMARESGLITED